MSTPEIRIPSPDPGLRSPLRHDIEAIRGKWVWILAMGLSLVGMGVIVLGSPYAGTAAVVWVVGLMLIFSGVAQGLAAFWTRDWSGFFVSLLLGVLYFVAGLFTLRHPDAAARSLTILIGSVMLIAGIFKVVVALTYRLPQWGWLLFSGILSSALGFYVWMEYQEFTPFLLGTLLGIDMIFNGWSWVAISLKLRKIGELVRRRLEARPESPGVA